MIGKVRDGSYSVGAVVSLFGLSKYCRSVTNCNNCYYSRVMTSILKLLHRTDLFRKLSWQLNIISSAGGDTSN